MKNKERSIFEDLLPLYHEGLLSKETAGVSTRAVEDTIEATIYLSGVGAESGGLAAAHAIHNGMTAVPSLHRAQHGEKVTFGLLAQLVLENAPAEEFSAAEWPSCSKITEMTGRSIPCEKPDILTIKTRMKK